jgi:hypothetical protein
MRQDLFGLLSEFTVLLLGAFLIVYAVSGRIGIPASPTVLMILGAVFIYWALRNWMRKEAPALRTKTHLRAGSLVIVGLLIITIPFSPLRDTSVLLGLAGAVLVLRGLVVAMLSVRLPKQG